LAQISNQTNINFRPILLRYLGLRVSHFI